MVAILQNSHMHYLKLKMLMDFRLRFLSIVAGKVFETRNGFGYTESWAEELEENLQNLLADTN